MSNIRITSWASGNVWSIYEGTAEQVLTPKQNLRRHILKHVTKAINDVAFADMRVIIEKVKEE